jgi:hypothetical protein
MVYGTYNELVTGANLNQLTSLGGLRLYSFSISDGFPLKNNEIIALKDDGGIGFVMGLARLASSISRSDLPSDFKGCSNRFICINFIETSRMIYEE